MSQRVDRDFRGTKRFQIVRRLGAGGMGVVYEALDRERNVRVAVKTLRSFDADRILRFKKEFRALQDLQHRNLVSLGELFEEAGHWFFTMELVGGVDLLSYVRPGHALERADTASGGDGAVTAPALARGNDRRSATYDERRLREALSQLVQGLTVLHTAQKVHRDVKPSNVRVSEDGRVVILDFGLVSDAAVGGHSTDMQVVGTAAYMAPEQAASKPVGPEADWYSVGVVLYEALTGELPHAGAPVEMLVNKQRFEPPPPRALVPDVPRDLDSLCADLLRMAPSSRPSGREILQRVGVREASRELVRSTISSFTQTPPFVGRQRELALLRGAFADSRSAPVAVVVHGESGVGKSALVRRSLEQLPDDAVVLSGRCYERESVPYKAFDGVVDSLSRYMSHLVPSEAGVLLPRHASLLAEVFPVLRRVEPIADAPRPQQDALDPKEQRTRLFAALRELLARLADRRPVVIVIEDLQWADADSLALLGEVMRPPDAPLLFLIGTTRSPDDALEQRLEAARSVTLERLERPDAEALADLLLERAARERGADHLPITPVDVAAEAAGHPLFIDELIRYSVLTGAATPARVRLEDALAARVRALDARSRQLLEIIAVAGAPLAQEVAAKAAAVDFVDLTKDLSLLRVNNLVRTSSDTVEPYHDRVRDAVLAQIAAPLASQYHKRLALALAGRENADPETLALHWHGAGEPDKAAEFACLAADRAARALAFDRAARLYAMALELRPVDGPRVRAKLAEALANAGRSASAAEAYLRASEGATAAESLDLQRRAAEQQLRSGRIDEGMATLRSVLAQQDIPLPTTPRRALLSLLARRARIRLRGLRFVERDASQIASERVARIDTLWSVATSLGMVDHIRGSDFQARHLLLALDAGEPYRIARALAVEACYVAATGNRRRAAQLIATSRELAERCGHPHALAWATAAEGCAATVLGDNDRVVETCERAAAMFRETCVGVAWELASIQTLAVWSLGLTGRWIELAQRVERGLPEALDRGDLFLATNLRISTCVFAWLGDDDVATARRMTREASEQWSQSTVHLQHLMRVWADLQIDLYEGAGARGLERLLGQWPSFERSLLLRVGGQGEQIREVRCRAILAAASGRPPSERDRLLRAAMRDVRWLESGSKIALAKPVGECYRALARAQQGDTERAIVLLRAATPVIREQRCPVWAAAFEHRLGELVGGSEGEAIRARANATLREQNIRRPERVVAMYAPL